MPNVGRFWAGQKVSNWLEAGLSWSGSTANGLATYGSSSSVVAESTATYDGTTLELTTSGGGLKLDGLDSTDANTLDDYEEGTWTAVSTVASGTLTITTGSDTQKYTKVGQMVTLHGLSPEFSAASGHSGTMHVTGLPFTNTNTQVEHEGDARAFGIGGLFALATAIDQGSAFGWIEKNESRITYYTDSATSAAFNANLVDTGTSIYFSGSYITDS